mgnify:CR=1 FL=1
MLKAIEERLKRLGVDDNDDFHDQIRQRVGKRATRLLEQRLKNLIYLIPKLLSRALNLCDYKEIPADLKKSLGFVMTYLYHPRDFLPEDNRKLFGYLDDAYCMGLVYEKVLRTLQKTGIELSEGDERFMREFGLTKRNIKAVIPEEAKKISEMVSGILKGSNDSFYAAFV